MSGRVTLAAVAGAHGIGGAVRLKLFTASLESLHLQKVFHAGDRTLTLQDLRPDKAGAIVRFAEIADRTQAEALRGTTLEVLREHLPPLEEGEYYHVDYIGRTVVAPDGALIGTVKSVENFGASDILDIELTGGKTAMVPFTRDVVGEDGDRLVIDPIWLG